MGIYSFDLLKYHQYRIRLLANAKERARWIPNQKRSQPRVHPQQDRVLPPSEHQTPTQVFAKDFQSLLSQGDSTVEDLPYLLKYPSSWVERADGIRASHHASPPIILNMASCEEIGSSRHCIYAKLGTCSYTSLLTGLPGGMYKARVKKYLRHDYHSRHYSTQERK